MHIGEHGPGAFGMHHQLDPSFFKGLLKLMILRKIKAGKNYPYAILKEFTGKNCRFPTKITKNDIYNTIGALEKGGYVKSRTVHVDGKTQKKYQLTAEGRRMLGKARSLIHDYMKQAKRLMAEFND